MHEPTDAGHDPGPADLLDELMPRWDVRSRHAVEVAAPLETTWRAVEGHRPSSSLVVRTLLRLRGLGGADATLRTGLTASGFSVLAERPGHEIVVGIAGRFWAVRETQSLVRVSDAEAFRHFVMPGAAKAAMTIRVEPLAAHTTRLATETRVACCDEGAARRFRLYWTLIGPFSGWIRREMLRGMQRDAEALARA